MKDGDAAFFVAGDPDKFGKFAGLARTSVGEELNLIDKERFELAWIVDFPMYEYNEDDKKVDFSHNPFSMPQGGLEALETQDPLTIKAFQYDITCNGFEIASGGIRNHRPEAMVKAFEIAGYGEQDVVERFGGMYRAFQYGAPPHGGMAAGVDRIVMLLCGTNNLREISLFPMNQQRRRPADGRAVGGHAEAVARAAHPAQSAANLNNWSPKSQFGAEEAAGGNAWRPILKICNPRRWPITGCRGRVSSRSRRPSRSPTSATWRWPIRRASRRPATRSPPIRREAASLTIRANLVAVVSNGTAVLGLGNIGPLASKPVMEGKAVLFKKFAGIDVFDIEIAADTIERVVETVAALEPTFGGINLEDIKGPECFEIEAQLKDADEDPGVPRRPARHRDHRRRRDQERAAAERQEARRRQDRRLRRRCCGDRLPQSAGLARRAAQEHLGLRHRRRGP